MGSKKEARIRNDFENHKATLSTFVDNVDNEEIRVLTWKEPGTITCSINYIIKGNKLFVSGDLGYAVYRWSECIDFGWLSGLSIDYFHGKCEASETGRDFSQWDETEALNYLKNMSENEYFEWERFSNSSGMGELYSKESWSEWCQDYGEDIFETSDYWEWAYDIGKVIHIRCYYHLIGLNMAMEQLKNEASEKD